MKAKQSEVGKKYDLLEELIRIQLGDKIYNEANLPISIERTPLYDGPITLEVYRKYFPKSDNIITAYLALSEDYRVRPELAELLRAIFNAEFRRLNFDKTKYPKKMNKMENKIKRGLKKLIKIVKEEFPK